MENECQRHGTNVQYQHNFMFLDDVKENQF